MAGWLRSGSEGNNGNIMLDIQPASQCTGGLWCTGSGQFSQNLCCLPSPLPDINCSPATTTRVTNLLALHSSGSPKQSLPMFFSSRPQSEGKSSSLPSALSELMVLGPKKTLLTPLVIGLETKIVCQTSDVRGGRGRLRH